MKLILVNRFFYPDTSATSRLLGDLAEHVSGFDAILVASSRTQLADAGMRLKPREDLGHIAIRRVWSTRFGRRHAVLKAIDMLSFHLTIGIFLLRHVNPGDLVVLKTDPPLLQLVNTTIIRIKKGKVINWIQDIYPEVALRLGGALIPSWLGHIMSRWRDGALRKARANVVVSHSMQAYLASRQIERLHVIPNWADEQSITPLAHRQNPLRDEWGLADKFTVMYSGNFGRVHAFEDIIAAAELLRDEPCIHFVFAGAGAALSQLKQQVVGLALNTVSFKPFQPEPLLRCSLAVADLHLVSLRPDMEDLLMPSKLYGILAAGRPVAFVGDADSAIAAAVERASAGFAIKAGHSSELADRIRHLAKNRQDQQNLGANARAWFEREYTRSGNLLKWQALLLGLRDGDNCEAVELAGARKQ